MVFFFFFSFEGLFVLTLLYLQKPFSEISLSHPNSSVFLDSADWAKTKAQTRTTKTAKVHTP